MYSRFILLACLISSLGCATKYQPQGFAGGYSEFRVADDAFRVTFNGNAYLSASTAAEYALLRAAEVSLENGFNYFVIVQEGAAVNRSSYTTPTTTSTTATVVGNTVQGSSTTYGGQTTTSEKHRVTLTLRGLRERPEGFSYDASLVAQSLREKYRLSPRQASP